MKNRKRVASAVVRASVVLAVSVAGMPLGAGLAAAGDTTVNCLPSPPAANVGVAQTIYNEGRARNVSGTVMLAAFETAHVESRFNNCSNGHSTSAGAFQQIDVGWGTYDQRTTVAYAARSFFTRAVDAERRLGVSASAGQIAQDVQKSAHPGRYDTARPDAERMLARVRPAIENVTNGAGTRIVGANAYLDVSSTGQVYAWNSRYHGGSPGGYGGRFVDARATRDGQGYVLVSSTGQIYAYGSATYSGGSPTGYTGAFVDVEMTPTGRGYWLLTSAGQVYSYGDARYFGGSPTGFDRAIVAISATPNGGGYVMVSKTGQVYAYGNAVYRGGSPGGISGEIADISHTAGSGYLLISTTGGHYAYGDARFVGNPSGFSGTF